MAVAVRNLLRVEIGRAALELDDVGGMVDDHVEVDLQPQPVRAGDEVGEVLVRAQMRVDVEEVLDPVAVIGRAVALDRLLAERRRHPQRGEPEVFDPRQAVLRVRAVAGQALESPPWKYAVLVGS